MDVPGIVEEALDGEEVAAQVDLGGDDGLFVTPTRTLIYRSEGLLSDESVASYSHNAEGLSLSEGRRKTRITLDHPIEGTEEFTLPSDAADEALPAILAGILGVNDVLGEGEDVVDTYLFSELTLVVTDDRLVKHVGETVWDLEFEEFPFADVTGVFAEQGNVATQLVIEVDGRSNRIKTPNDRAREVRETLEDALRRYHGLRPDDDLNEALAPAEPEEPKTDATEASDDASASSSGMDFGEGVDPLSAGDTTETGANPDPMELEREQPDDGAESETAEPTPSESAGGESAAPESSAADASDSNATEATDAEAEGQPADGTRAEPSADREATTRRTDAGTANDEQPAQDDHADASTTADPTAASAPPAAETVDDVGAESEGDSNQELAEEVEELRVAVQKQNKLLTRQHKTIKKLVEELRRGR